MVERVEAQGIVPSVGCPVFRLDPRLNFLLVPSAISRHIARRASRRVEIDAETISTEIDQIVETMREGVIQDATATLILARDKKSGLPKANQVARAAVAARWETREERWALAPGKEILSRLSAWSQNIYGVAFGADAIARELRSDEVDAEVAEVLDAMVSARRFRAPFAMPKA